MTWNRSIVANDVLPCMSTSRYLPSPASKTVTGEGSSALASSSTFWTPMKKAVGVWDAYESWNVTSEAGSPTTRNSSVGPPAPSSVFATSVATGVSGAVSATVTSSGAVSAATASTSAGGVSVVTSAGGASVATSAGAPSSATSAATTPSSAAVSGVDGSSATSVPATSVGATSATSASVVSPAFPVSLPEQAASAKTMAIPGILAKRSVFFIGKPPTDSLVPVPCDLAGNAVHRMRLHMTHTVDGITSVPLVF